MITVTIDQAANRLSHWIDLIGRGEEVVVMDHEQPVARITRITRCAHATGLRPQVGTLTSAPVRYQNDCFAPLNSEELSQWGI